MRIFTLFFIIGVSTAALIIPNPNKAKIPSTSLSHGYGKGKGIPMDWFADLIEQHLKMKTGELVKQIDTITKGLDILVHDAVVDLEKVLESVDGSVKDKIAEIILKALIQALNILKPIQDQLDTVMPYISSQFRPRDFVSDIIYVLLGITLQEFLTEINVTLGKTEELVQLTYEQLLEVSKELDGSAAEDICDIIQNSILASQHLMEPLLRMLGLIIPSINSGDKIVRELKFVQFKSNQLDKQNKRNGAEEVGGILGIEPMALVEKAVLAYLGLNGVMAEMIKDLDVIFQKGDYDGKETLEILFNEADGGAMESLDPIAEVLSPVLDILASEKNTQARKTSDEIIQEHLGISLRSLINIFEVSSANLDIIIYKFAIDLKYIATNVDGQNKVDADKRIELGNEEAFSITLPFRAAIQAILDKNQFGV